MMQVLRGSLALLGLFIFSSCANFDNSTIQQTGQSARKVNQKIEVMAHKLVANIRQIDLSSKSIAITTFIPLDDLDDSSRFGRYVSEHLSEELFKLGFEIRELRTKEMIEINPGRGEFALSRNLPELFKKYQVDAFIGGTYSVVGRDIVLHARMVTYDTSRLVSAGSVEYRLGYKGMLKEMIEGDKGKERPVVKVYNEES